MLNLSLVKQHLRVLHNREDEVIETYISAAFSAFEQFTERKLYETLDDLELDQDAPPYSMALSYISAVEGENGTESKVNYRNDIVSGALIYIGYLYTVRDMDASMPRAVESLWWPYKVMRIA